MLDKLKTITDRYEALTSQLEDPATYANPELLRRLTREQKEIEPVAEAYRAYRRAEADADAAQELLGDPELREMAQEEAREAREEMERLREEQAQVESWQASPDAPEALAAIPMLRLDQIPQEPEQLPLVQEERAGQAV